MVAGHSRDIKAKSASVYEALRKQAMEGALVPGQALHPDAIAALFPVSKTPVLAALERLTVEGFIERTVNKGFRTKAFLLDEQRAWITFGLELYCLCVKWSMPRMSAAAHAQMAALAARVDRDRGATGYFSDQEQINAMFADEAGNEPMGQALMLSLDRTFLVRKLDVEATFDAPQAAGSLQLMEHMLRQGEVSAMTRVIRRIVEGRLERLPETVERANAQAMSSNIYYNQKPRRRPSSEPGV